MARPKRNNADYFSHDAGMRDDPKIKALRNKFGITGYAIYCMMLEVLTNSDFFKREIDEIEIEILSADFGIDAELFEEIIAYMVRLKLLQIEDNCRYLSQKLTERLQSVTDKRNNARKKVVSVTESTQSKVNKSKVNKSKVNKSKVNKTKEDKDKHLDCVFLTDDQFSKLVKKYETEEKLKSAIDILNNYKMSNNKKYDSDYHVLIGWVFDKFKSDDLSPKPTSQKRALIDLDRNTTNIFMTEEEANSKRPEGTVNNGMVALNGKLYFNPWANK